MAHGLVHGQVYFIPSRDYIEKLEIGGLVLDAFGNWAKVTSISARKEDINGKLFACFYAEFGADSTMSGSVKEDCLVRTAALSSRHTSAELDAIEQTLRIAQS